MFLISEDEVARFSDYDGLIGAMDEVFAACASGQASTFPFVREYLAAEDAYFGIKSGCNLAGRLLGLKAGGYWNRNSAMGVDRHQSTVLLVDPSSGRARALVAGNNLTALRTAAASAAATRRLSRPDAASLAILGTGRQALFQIAATARVRPVRSVVAWSPTLSNIDELRDGVRALGIAFGAAGTPQEAARTADIVITVTPAKKPLLSLADVRPGTHISAMGSDTAGKRELGDDLLEKASVWADDVKQAREIGECQHLPATRPIASLGDVLLGLAPGRASIDEITVYDGTGLGLQDLAGAEMVIGEGLKAGALREVEF